MKAITIFTDYGGMLVLYFQRFTEYWADGTHVAIRGMCASACTMFLGLPHNQVCVSPQAWLVFHAPRPLYGTITPKQLQDSKDFLLSFYPDYLRRDVTPLTPRLQYIRGQYFINHGFKECPR